MGIAACELSQYVIRPTLVYLDRYSLAAEAMLLATAATQSALGATLETQQYHSIYRISAERHAALWDYYLARDPELASLVRGLASQHAFFGAPHLELTVNLRYATAIAWLMIEESRLPLPEPDDHQGQARLWRKVFNPRGRLHDFHMAWQRCSETWNQVA
ncbi:hypothetical protein [Pseudomonas luteola]|uniref:hypothetical protein n=1 Tax=Pseudomonas luteola TaxID=47886 RepID=UPI00289A0AA0|nr:hypothetical protein [Pseudomonas luteola]